MLKRTFFYAPDPLIDQVPRNDATSLTTYTTHPHAFDTKIYMYIYVVWSCGKAIIGMTIKNYYYTYYYINYYTWCYRRCKTKEEERKKEKKTPEAMEKWKWELLQVGFEPMTLCIPDWCTCRLHQSILILKVIHVHHALRKMFITLVWNVQQFFLPAPISYNSPSHSFWCMSNFNPWLHYWVTCINLMTLNYRNSGKFRTIKIFV